MHRTLFDICCLAFVLFCAFTGHYIFAIGGLLIFCLQLNFNKFDK